MTIGMYWKDVEAKLVATISAQKKQQKYNSKISHLAKFSSMLGEWIYYFSK
jgi:hypothetical protein